MKHPFPKRASFINSSQGSSERGNAGSKRSDPNDESIAEGAMDEEEDRSGKAAADRTPDEFMKEAPKRIFITGTDTGVGKTIISSILTLALKAAYWKPIQSGLETDTSRVQQLTQLPPHHFFPESYLLRSPLSPHAASKIDGLCIDMDKIRFPKSAAFPFLIIEGCGGVMVPLNDAGDLMVDLMGKWRIPTLVVCRSSLGTINHTLLTINTLRLNHIPILGVIMNGPKNSSNRQAIERYGQVKIIGEIEPQAEMTPAILRHLYSCQLKVSLSGCAKSLGIDDCK